MLPASEEAIMRAIVGLADETLLTGQSFAIRAHRSIPSSLSRRKIEVDGGSEVLQAMRERGAKVDLTKPDVIIFVDLAGDRAYVYCEKVQGPGGLPLSSQWRMLAVLDSGLLTVLAAFAVMRRGCLVELFIPISDTIPSFEKHRQLDIARKLRTLVTRTNYRAFTVGVEGLLGGVPASLSLGDSEIRRMVRLAAMSFAKEKKFRGIIFADIAGEIAAWKRPAGLENPQLPIFHPLVGMDREDLTEMCKQIGLREEEIVPLDYAQIEADVPNEVSHFPKGLAGHIVQPISL
jgi:thiamine biosynthesis protein ThiI